MSGTDSGTIAKLITLLFCSLAILTGCGNDGTPSQGPGPTANANLMGGAIQAKALDLNGTVSTLAGDSFVVSGPMPTFYQSYGVATDGTNLYVTDTGSHSVRKVEIASGTVTTLAGGSGSGSADGIGAAAQFDRPSGIATDGTNLYVADQGNSTIRKVVIATGKVTTLAGAAGTIGSSDGTGSAALFNNPSGITSDGTNLYVADYLNGTIRKVEIATGAVSTVAGTAGVTGTSDGVGSSASFRYPTGITTDGVDIFVTDSGNHEIRKIEIATGVVTTLAGSPMGFGSSDGTGAAAQFARPAGITTDGVNLYVTDMNNHNLRKVVISTGAVTTLAGDATRPSGVIDGIGSAARFVAPSGVATDGSRLYVTDIETYAVRAIAIANGAVTTLAGTAGPIGSSDGVGSAARFNNPEGITTDGTNLYVADMVNNAIRKIVIATGAVTTLAGSASNQAGFQDGVGAAARFRSPYSITTDGVNVYVGDLGNGTIRKVVIATGAVTTLAGSPGGGVSSDGIGSAASFGGLVGMTTDGKNLYVLDAGKNSVRKVVIATGEVSTLAGSWGAAGASGGTVVAIAPSSAPTGITTDGTNLYVTDTSDATIRKVAIATGEVTILAGSSGAHGNADGTGAEARFWSPTYITSDGTNLFVSDGWFLRKVVIATGAVTSLYIENVFGTMTTDGTRLYVANQVGNTIDIIE